MGSMTWLKAFCQCLCSIVTALSLCRTVLTLHEVLFHDLLSWRTRCVRVLKTLLVACLARGAHCHWSWVTDWEAGSGNVTLLDRQRCYRSARLKGDGSGSHLHCIGVRHRYNLRRAPLHCRYQHTCAGPNHETSRRYYVIHWEALTWSYN